MYSTELTQLKASCGGKLLCKGFGVLGSQLPSLNSDTWFCILSYLKGNDVLALVKTCHGFTSLLTSQVMDTCFNKFEILLPYFGKEENWSVAYRHVKRKVLNKPFAYDVTSLKAHHITLREDFDRELMTMVFPHGYMLFEMVSPFYSRLKVSDDKLMQLIYGSQDPLISKISARDSKRLHCLIANRNPCVKWEHFKLTMQPVYDVPISTLDEQLCHPCVPLDLVDLYVKLGTWLPNDALFSLTVPLEYIKANPDLDWNWDSVVQREDVSYSCILSINKRTALEPRPLSLVKFFTDSLTNVYGIQHCLTTLKCLSPEYQVKCFGELLTTRKLSDKDFEVLFSKVGEVSSTSKHESLVALGASPHLTFERLKRFGHIQRLPIEGLACNPSLSLSEVMAYIAVTSNR